MKSDGRSPNDGVSETNGYGLADDTLPAESIGDPMVPVFARCIFPLPHSSEPGPACEIADGRIVFPAREVPVIHKTDVVVVGGGSAGFSAAVAAARTGAKVALVEKTGSLGGLFTNGMVLIVLATSRKEANGSWTFVTRGICKEFADRAVALGPRVARGKADGTSNWQPTIDPEGAKYLMDRMVEEAKVEMFFHAEGISVVRDGNRVTGVVFHTKQGLQAVCAKVVVDCTGDGDVAFAAGAPYRQITHAIGFAVRLGNVDRITAKRPPKEPGIGFDGCPNLWPLRGNEANRSTLWRGRLGPTGNGLSVHDLTKAEIAHRKYWWEFVSEMQRTPGWEEVYLASTCSQIGPRATRLIETDLIVDRSLLAREKAFADVIGWGGQDGPCPAMPIPYRSLLPRGVDNILCAGRMLGAPDTVDSFRLIGPCFVTGQAAGTAAALASKCGVAPRELGVKLLQRTLEDQDVCLA